MTKDLHTVDQEAVYKIQVRYKRLWLTIDGTWSSRDAANSWADWNYYGRPVFRVIRLHPSTLDQ